MAFTGATLANQARFGHLTFRELLNFGLLSFSANPAAIWRPRWEAAAKISADSFRRELPFAPQAKSTRSIPLHSN
jgi:hypothetical protein